MYITNGKIYGESFSTVVTSVQFSAHREPENQHDKNSEWHSYTDLSVRFQDGGYFTKQLVDETVNIHKGDRFSGYSHNNRYTYVKSDVTGRVYIDNPFLTAEGSQNELMKFLIGGVVVFLIIVALIQ